MQLKYITQEIAEIVAQSPISDRLAQISPLHTTAGLILNEVQKALLGDVTTMFEQVIPRGVYYNHNDLQLTGGIVLVFGGR